MTDTISPTDLARYTLADIECRDADLRAKQAQQQHVQAIGALQFVSREIAKVYDIHEGDVLDPQTGVITRAQPKVQDLADGFSKA